MSKELRDMIRSLIREGTQLHRCVDGSLVPADSHDCLDDIRLRIDDAVYHRDTCSHGSATRGHYNGMLADLRKKERRLKKNFSMMEAKDTRRDVATARLKGLRRKNIKDIMFGDEDSTVHNPESSLNDTRRFIKTIWRQHADIPALSDALNIVHWFGWQNHNERTLETLENFATSAPPGTRASHQISVMGYKGAPQYHGFNCFGILLSKESRITFASNDDVWSEEMSTATQEIIDYYGSSGLPKRPSAGIAPGGLIYSPEDIKGEYVHELVMDNWSWNSIVVGNNSNFNEDLKADIKEWCEENGVSFHEFGEIS